VSETATDATDSAKETVTGDKSDASESDSDDDTQQTD